VSEANRLRISLVAAEAFPFYKVGGLGDVVGGLSLGLARQGFKVQVLIPWYRSFEIEPAGRVRFDFAGGPCEASYGRVRHEGVDFVFVDPEGFERGTAYGTADEVPAYVRI
jgi:starch synthase